MASMDSFKSRFRCENLCIRLVGTGITGEETEDVTNLIMAFTTWEAIAEMYVNYRFRPDGSPAVVMVSFDPDGSRHISSDSGEYNILAAGLDESRMLVIIEDHGTLMIDLNAAISE